LRALAAVLQRNKNWHRRIDESLGLGCLPSVPGYSASYPGTVGQTARHSATRKIRYRRLPRYLSSGRVPGMRMLPTMMTQVPMYVYMIVLKRTCHQSRNH
jgi:hypothetical protein